MLAARPFLGLDACLTGGTDVPRWLGLVRRNSHLYAGAAVSLALPLVWFGPMFDSLQPEMVSLLHDAVQRFEPTFAHYGLLGVFVLVMAEGCGVPAPGLTVLVVGGLMAGRGEIGIMPLLLTGWVAAITGNLLGYVIGRYGGRHLLGYFSIQGERLRRIEGFFQRNTIALLVVSRFVEGLKQTAGLVAGTLSVGLARFVAGTVAGATLWVAVFGFGSFWLERNFAAVFALFHHARPWGWGLSALLLGGLLLVLVRSSRTVSD